MNRFAAAILVLLLPLLVPAALHAQPRSFGAPMPTGEAVPLGALLGARAKPPAWPAKVSGRITEVCQKEGCWMVLADGERFARVAMADHAFAVPKDAQGRALVYGTLREVDVDPAEAGHLEADGAQAPPPREYRIEATSVQLLD